MNAPLPLQYQPAFQPPRPLAAEKEEINLREYADIIIDNRRLIGWATALSLAAAGIYSLLSPPVFETNLIIQVEDSAGSAKSFLGEAASLFDVKTQAAAEIEILRSRLVIGEAVDSTLAYVSAAPSYFPIFGKLFARHAHELSNPGVLGFGGWVFGKESIKVSKFDVPKELETESFQITSLPDKGFELRSAYLPAPVVGTVGTRLEAQTPSGPVELVVAELQGKPGAEFTLRRRPRLECIEDLQTEIKLVERGRQSGIIEATLQGKDPSKLSELLNAIGRGYIRQNVERKAAEAQKTLAFLDSQLPQFKKALESSEAEYNKYRNAKGTVALDEEAKLLLTTTTDLQSKLLEAQQKRRELASHFTDEHPTVKTLDDQIRAWNREIAVLNDRVKALPSVQQDALRLERDVKVNNELYRQLQNDAIQLQLVREGKVGNVRLIDAAVAPAEPIRPKKIIAFAAALVAGMIGGMLLALLRAASGRGVRNSHEIETSTGLAVYSTVPLSSAQSLLADSVRRRVKGLHVLAHLEPHDPSIEALRSLRTALQFAMLEGSNNRVLVTGSTPGVGKSFVSVNLAAVIAASGKRVLLVDADLRKGHLSAYFGVNAAAGLSDALIGQVSFDEAIRPHVLQDLDLLPTGTLPPNPAELLGSSGFTSMLEEVSSRYDLVLIDSAPILVAADTLSLAAQSDTILLISRAEKTEIIEIQETVKQISRSGKDVTGIVLNGVDLTRRNHGRYGHRYGNYLYQPYKTE